MIALCHCQVLVCVWLCGSVDGVCGGGVYMMGMGMVVYMCVCVRVCLQVSSIFS